MRVGPKRRLSIRELMLLNCGAREKTLESPLDSKEIQPVNRKGSQPWIFTGKTDAEAETPIHGSLEVKSWLIGKDTDAGKDWRQEKGAMEDERLNGITYSMDICVSKFWETVRTEKPGMLQSMGLQIIKHLWATELNWTKSFFLDFLFLVFSLT